MASLRRRPCVTWFRVSNIGDLPRHRFFLVTPINLQLLPDNAERFSASGGDNRSGVEGGIIFQKPSGFADIAARLRQVQYKINRLCTTHGYNFILPIYHPAKMYKPCE